MRAITENHRSKWYIFRSVMLLQNIKINYFNFYYKTIYAFRQFYVQSKTGNIYIYIFFSLILDHMKMLIFVSAFFFAVSFHEYPVNQWLSLGALKALCTVSGLKMLRWWQFFMRKETISDISTTKITDYPFPLLPAYTTTFLRRTMYYIFTALQINFTSSFCQGQSYDTMLDAYRMPVRWNRSIQLLFDNFLRFEFYVWDRR